MLRTCVQSWESECDCALTIAFAALITDVHTALAAVVLPVACSHC